MERPTKPAGAPEDLVPLPDPLAWFKVWYDEAIAAGTPNPDALIVATADAEGNPSVRFVLLKGADERGFTFYTNTESRKGRELRARPRAALCFYWREISRSVRLEGSVEEVGAAEADAHFNSRARMSRLAAIASDQSRPLESRDVLEERMRQLQERYRDVEPPRPRNWSGYRVRPETYEFWRSRPNRLHDRWLYTRPSPDAPWTITRLYP